MRIGLVGYPGSGKSAVFGALTGIAVDTGFGKQRENVGVVKVPDARVDALARLYAPKKVTYAEITFTDLAAGHSEGIDRKTLNAMRNVDALCQVLRDFPDAAGQPGDPLAELTGFEMETLLADLEVVEARVARLRKDRSNPNELHLLERIQEALEAERPARALDLSEEERKTLSGYSLLTLKPLLLVLNVKEEDVAKPAPDALRDAASERGLGLVVLSALVEMEIAQMEEADQRDFAASLGLAEPASHRFIRAAFELIDLISMLTSGPDECRAWPVPRGIHAPRAAGKIHSDIERGFIRAEVIHWEDLVALGSEAKCREAGKLRVEGKSYVVQDGDVVHFRFNV
ncbi:MAG: YchF family ATPase [Myxococcales bacterium]|nr:YchF family ATPase [Myxococcales bacterium]MDH5305930.1 YchF family ATPase [Myxococcales bacterium]MDH5566517.1 YchF family ATPase [Myxococcales bacterium]